jgi:hypothetical protein
MDARTLSLRRSIATYHDDDDGLTCQHERGSIEQNDIL